MLGVGFRVKGFFGGLGLSVFGFRVQGTFHALSSSHGSCLNDWACCTSHGCRADLKHELRAEP